MLGNATVKHGKHKHMQDGEETEIKQNLTLAHKPLMCLLLLLLVITVKGNLNECFYLGEST